MKLPPAHAKRPRAMTLIELSVVILILLSLIGLGMHSTGRLDDWKLGRAAAETLRTVHSAQRTYLADHPTTAVTALTHAALLPYMPGAPAAMPTITALDGRQLTIRVNVIPPVVSGSGTTTYDPSGSSTDMLWDIGD